MNTPTRMALATAVMSLIAASTAHAAEKLIATETIADFNLSTTDVVVTVPFKVIDQMMNHPLTDQGLAKFLADWEKTKQSVKKQPAMA